MYFARLAKKFRFTAGLKRNKIRAFSLVGQNAKACIGPGVGCAHSGYMQKTVSYCTSHVIPWPEGANAAINGSRVVVPHQLMCFS